MVSAGSALLIATIPMIVAAGVIITVTDAAFRRNGKPVGVNHFHFRSKTGKSVERHRHEGGGRRHGHPRLFGYGRTRRSLKR